MQASMYSMSVPVFTRMLNNVSAILDKAIEHVESRKIDPTALLRFRLYPDMLSFTRQIQVACDSAKSCAARLAGIEIPKFEDNESSFTDLKARIDKTIAYIEAVDREAIENASERDVTIPARDRTLHMKGMPYLTEWALPNFFFHVAMTYAILRHNGVELGKSDFIGKF